MPPLANTKVLPIHLSGCPEKQILACCARTRFCEKEARELRSLLGRTRDWSYLVREAREHSMTPLVERHLRIHAAGLVPPEYRRHLAELSRANTVRCLYLAAELRNVMDELARKSVRGIPYKGPVLAVQAYGDMAAREFDDLDVIIAQKDLPKAHEVLMGLGYQPRFPWMHSGEARKAITPGEYNYRDEARRIMLEIHTELTLRHFPACPDLEAFLRRLVRVELAGKTFETFSAEDGLTALSIHGAKDFWERIIWVADVSELIQANPGLDWDQAIGTADLLNAGRMLRLGLLLAAHLLGTPLPTKAVRFVQGDSVARQVAGEIEKRFLERDPQRLDARMRLRFRRRMVEGFSEGWRYAARLALLPAEEDWQSARIPSSLSPLYAALRPLRLFRKFRHRGQREVDSNPERNR